MHKFTFCLILAAIVAVFAISGTRAGEAYVRLYADSLVAATATNLEVEVGRWEYPTITGIDFNGVLPANAQVVIKVTYGDEVGGTVTLATITNASGQSSLSFASRPYPLESGDSIWFYANGTNTCATNINARITAIQRPRKAN